MPLESLLIGPASVNVPGKQLAVKRLGPSVSQVNHHAHVRVAATQLIGSAIARVEPFLASVKVPVVGMHVEQFVDVRIGIKGEGPIIMRVGIRCTSAR